MARVDVDELRDKVKVMYRAVAEAPKASSTSRWDTTWRGGSATRPESWMAFRPKPSSRSPAST